MHTAECIHEFLFESVFEIRKYDCIWNNEHRSWDLQKIFQASELFFFAVGRSIKENRKLQMLKRKKKKTRKINGDLP